MDALALLAGAATQKKQQQQDEEKSASSSSSSPPAAAAAGNAAASTASKPNPQQQQHSAQDGRNEATASSSSPASAAQIEAHFKAQAQLQQEQLLLQHQQQQMLAARGAGPNELYQQAQLASLFGGAHGNEAALIAELQQEEEWKQQLLMARLGGGGGGVDASAFAQYAALMGGGDPMRGNEDIAAAMLRERQLAALELQRQQQQLAWLGLGQEIGFSQDMQNLLISRQLQQASMLRNADMLLGGGAGGAANAALLSGAGMDGSMAAAAADMSQSQTGGMAEMNQAYDQLGGARSDGNRLLQHFEEMNRRKQLLALSGMAPDMAPSMDIHGLSDQLRSTTPAAAAASAAIGGGAPSSYSANAAAAMTLQQAAANDAHGQALQQQQQQQLQQQAEQHFPPMVCSEARAEGETKESKGSTIILPCRARGMPMDHNVKTAYFVVSEDIKHGQELFCSYYPCRNAGTKFRYCVYCNIPVAKRNFRKRHKHAGKIPRNALTTTMTMDDESDDGSDETGKVTASTEPPATAPAPMPTPTPSMEDQQPSASAPKAPAAAAAAAAVVTVAAKKPATPTKKPKTAKTGGRVGAFQRRLPLNGPKNSSPKSSSKGVDSKSSSNISSLTSSFSTASEAAHSGSMKLNQSPPSKTIAANTSQLAQKVLKELAKKKSSQVMVVADGASTPEKKALRICDCLTEKGMMEKMTTMQPIWSSLLEKRPKTSNVVVLAAWCEEVLAVSNFDSEVLPIEATDDAAKKVSKGGKGATNAIDSSTDARAGTKRKQNDEARSAKQDQAEGKTQVGRTDKQRQQKKPKKLQEDEDKGMCPPRAKTIQEKNSEGDDNDAKGKAAQDDKAKMDERHDDGIEDDMMSDEDEEDNDDDDDDEEYIDEEEESRRKSKSKHADEDDASVSSDESYNLADARKSKRNKK